MEGRDVDVLAVEVAAGEPDDVAAVGRGDLGDRAVAGDEALVTGPGQAVAARQQEQAGKRGAGRGAESGGQGRFSSVAPPAEKGAFLSPVGIRSPAGSE
ncbi:hypothetical protein NLS1_16850 [Nocardioides sp. LS1]|nr:hypothetical protein NLS1_16850 [Nocardioides sp. LS1]